MNGFETCNERHLHELVDVVSRASPKERGQGRAAHSNELVARVAIASPPVEGEHAVRRTHVDRGFHDQNDPDTVAKPPDGVGATSSASVEGARSFFADPPVMRSIVVATPSPAMPTPSDTSAAR